MSDSDAGWREYRVENAEQKPDTQPRSLAQERQVAREQQRAEPEAVMEAHIERGRQAFRERYEGFMRTSGDSFPPMDLGVKER